MKEWYHRVPEFLYCDLRKEEIPPSYQSLIQKVGCLFHPLAKEYLNEDVIKELEQVKEQPQYVSHDSYYDVFNLGFKRGCERAIKLLKEYKK
jgi:hypothetical protein